MVFINKKNLIFILIGILAIIILLLFYKTKNNNKITDDKYIAMYKLIIDLIMDTSPELNSNAKNIAIDTDSFSLLKDKELLIDYMKKYNSNVFKSSFDELEKQNYISEENPTLEGILISVSNVKKEKQTIDLEITKYKSTLSSVTNRYEATYKDDSWDIKLISVGVS